ncbi:MAG: PEP/pyruvate-binding domain-containing protein [Candidatus Micrarchaeota archaeon]|nr:PEP/pyruvate-binding domain-containing protein [Candidatus Micrarchaeota archaeon]
METKIILSELIKDKRVIHCPKTKFVFEGQPGGKWLGTNYFYKLLKDSSTEIKERFKEEVFFICPKTTVIQTDLFKEFMDQNNLWELAYSIDLDQVLKMKFLNATFNNKQKSILASVLEDFRGPITLRSSALTEDAERVSFAGVFYSVELPNIHRDFKVRLKQFEDAMKLIYFSQYSRHAKEFYSRCNILAGDERMAVLVQELCGMPHKSRLGLVYYPELSFVGFSYNEYAINMINPNDGVYRLAFGLGAGVVEIEDKTAITINIGRPKPIIGLNTKKEIILNSPKYFYALDLHTNKTVLTKENSFRKKLPITELEQEILLRHGSYYNEDFLAVSHIFKKENYNYYVDFSNSINKKKIGINSVIEFLRDMLRDNFEKDVDFEGAIDIIKDGAKNYFVFYPLQARFQVRGEEQRKEKLSEIEKDRILIVGENGLGKGHYVIYFVIYVDRKLEELFRYSEEISNEINLLNLKLKGKGVYSRYLLITPGRFGTEEKSVGVVGNFSTISHANAIIEVLNKTEFLQSSLGTHFFEDIRAAGIAYLYTKNFQKSQKEELFKKAKKIERVNHCYLLEFQQPLILELDKKNNYMIYFSP